MAQPAAAILSREACPFIKASAAAPAAWRCWLRSAAPHHPSANWSLALGFTCRRRGCAPQLILGVFALFARHTILDHCPNRVVGWGSVMGLDAGRVLTRSVLCPHCNEDYIFTLRDIADNPELRCHGCGGSIRLSDRAYEPLLSDVRNTLDEIDSAPPSFVSAHYRPVV